MLRFLQRVTATSRVWCKSLSHINSYLSCRLIGLYNIFSHLSIGLRGKSGGYRLTKTPGEYTVGNILRLTEGSLAPVACLGQDPVECPRMVECRTLPMWRKLNTMINDYFDGITLADLVSTAQPGNDYVI